MDRSKGFCETASLEAYVLRINNESLGEKWYGQDRSVFFEKIGWPFQRDGHPII
jgi:hypothetical protein